MRIAIFEPKFLLPRPNASTNIVLLQNQAKSLARLGNDVFVFAEESMYPSAKVEEDLSILPLQGKLTSYNSLLSPTRQSIPYFSDLFSPDIIAGIIKKLNKELSVDVIYTCGSSFSAILPAILGKATGIPTVHYVLHCPSSQRWWRRDIETMKGYKLPIKYLIRQFAMDAMRELPRREIFEKWGLRKITRIIASSNYVKKTLHNLNPENVQVVYPGVEIPQLDEGFKQAGKPIIAYLGHFWQGRGILDLVVAFLSVSKLYPELKLLIAASNVHELTKHYFEKLVDSNWVKRTNIVWKGIVKDLYREVMAPSRAIVLPYRDVPSMKLIESMAFGKTVITTRVGWTEELISDGVSGFLVDVGDVKGIADKLELLVNDAELAEKVGKNAREVARLKCDINTNTELILSTLKEISQR